MENQGSGQFLQSDFWFKILAADGEEVLSFSGAKACAKDLPLGRRYFYLPRGPIFSSDKQAAAKNILETARLAAHKNNLAFLRLEPSRDDFAALQGEAAVKGLRLIKTINLQPQKTWLLDLNKSLEQLTKELSQKTRYNIRLAEKKKVEILPGSIKDFDEFWRLMKITGERDNFGIHGKKHYRHLVEGGENIELWLAKFAGQVIAAGIFCFYDGQATYLHGASDNQFRNLMAPHLLQWTVIQEAKKRGFNSYDFYGIDEKKWPGVTRFKKGFGGQELVYPGTYDLVLQPVYYYIYQKIRAIYRACRKFL